MIKRAVIDIGTNTCLLLIAEADHIGYMQVISDVHAIARLGAGVDKSKNIQPDAYERLKKILTNHKKVIEEKKVPQTCVIATSAMRDAENRYEIIKKIKDDCGFEIELLSGEDESLWSYRGAMCGLSKEELQLEVGALDIGGGSTEVSFGRNGKYQHGQSINIGAVRITERFLSARNPDSVILARQFVKSEIEAGLDRNISIKKLIAVAGTPTALGAMKLKLHTFDSHKVNRVIISAHELQTMSSEIFSLSAEELIKKYPAVHPSRADILPAGSLILEEIIKFLHIDEFQISTFGLRFGMMIREFEKIFNAKSDAWVVEY
jgi:exopolyphosphatase/guanosine-5'-triphosphate,3'-diphosphate pyrophosphatase